MKVRGRKHLNVDRARELRAEGLTWREVGEMLAIEERRLLPYQGPAVREACNPGPFKLAKMLARELARA